MKVWRYRGQRSDFFHAWMWALKWAGSLFLRFFVVLIVTSPDYSLLFLLSSSHLSVNASPRGHDCSVTRTLPPSVSPPPPPLSTPPSPPHPRLHLFPELAILMKSPATARMTSPIRSVHSLSLISRSDWILLTRLSIYITITSSVICASDIGGFTFCSGRHSASCQILNSHDISTPPFSSDPSFQRCPRLLPLLRHRS